MLQITPRLALDDDEIELSAIRAQGAGGQNVNKTSTAIHLRFDAAASKLPQAVKDRLLALRDQRISSDGVIVIKAQRFRNQERNREDALARLRELLRSACTVPRKRVPTQPTRAAKKRRADSKVKRGRVKALRGKVSDD